MTRKIPDYRRKHDWSREKLRHCRHRFAVLVRPWVERAADDVERQRRLSAAGVRAVEMGLWKYTINSDRTYSRLTSSAILGIWRRIDAPGVASWNGSFGWHNWLYDHGWTACGEISTKFRKGVA